MRLNVKFSYIVQSNGWVSLHAYAKEYNQYHLIPAKQDIGYIGMSNRIQGTIEGPLTAAKPTIKQW